MIFVLPMALRLYLGVDPSALNGFLPLTTLSNLNGDKFRESDLNLKILFYAGVENLFAQKFELGRANLMQIAGERRGERGGGVLPLFSAEVKAKLK